MSDKELSRVNVIQAVCEKRLRRRDAAAQLELTERQVQRLVNRYRESGAAGLAHGNRGKLGNHCLPESFRLRVLALLHQHYPDFGPTLAAEKLRERHDLVGTVLKLAQDKMDELERQNKRSRSKSMPGRRAQVRIQEQLRAVNPVLTNPDEFKVSLTK